MKCNMASTPATLDNIPIHCRVPHRDIDIRALYHLTAPIIPRALTHEE